MKFSEDRRLKNKNTPILVKGERIAYNVNEMKRNRLYHFVWHDDPNFALAYNGRNIVILHTDMREKGKKL